MSDYKLQTKSVKIPFYKQRPRTSILLDILSVLFLCGGGIGMLTGIAMAAFMTGAGRLQLCLSLSEDYLP